jgi:ribosomal protein L35
VTGTGKILRRKGPQAHKLEKKSAKLKRSFRRPTELAGSDYRAVIRLLGGKKRGR